MMLPAGAPPALAQVAQRYAETSRGIVGVQLHRVFEVHGGFSRRTEDLVMNGIYDDGALIRVHVVSYAINGKTAGAGDVASLEQSWNHPKSDEVFAPPFDPRHFDAYAYRSATGSAIAFTSAVRDAGHGSGSFAYDAQGNVVSYTFTPNTLPPHASFGQIVDRRAEVLPGYWASTQETQQYRGSYGPFAAAGSIEVDYSDFHRFADLPTALRTLTG
jgi:hypothetical protein